MLEVTSRSQRNPSRRWPVRLLAVAVTVALAFHRDSYRERKERRLLLGDDPKRNKRFDGIDFPDFKERIPYLEWYLQNFKPPPHRSEADKSLLRAVSGVDHDSKDLYVEGDEPWLTPQVKQVQAIRELCPLPWELVKQHKPHINKFTNISARGHVKHIKAYLERALKRSQKEVNGTGNLDVIYLERDNKPWLREWVIVGEDNPAMLQIDERHVKHEPDVFWDERFGLCTLMMLDLDHPNGYWRPPRPKSIKKLQPQKGKILTVKEKPLHYDDEEILERRKLLEKDMNEVAKLCLEKNSKGHGKFGFRTGDDGPYLHWLLTDAYRNCSSGNIIYRYRGPRRYAAGKHRYALLLFKQKGNKGISPPLSARGKPGQFIRERAQWPVKRFLEANPHLELAATNYFVMDHRNKSMRLYNFMLGDRAREDWEPRDQQWDPEDYEDPEKDEKAATEAALAIQAAFNGPKPLHDKENSEDSEEDGFFKDANEESMAAKMGDKKDMGPSILLSNYFGERNSIEDDTDLGIPDHLKGLPLGESPYPSHN